MQLAYKIVSVKSQDKKHHRKREYTSAVAEPPYSVTYRIGEIARPSIGKLFVFKDYPSLESLKITAGGLWEPGMEGTSLLLPRSTRVFLCLVDTLEIANDMAVAATSYSIENFWCGYDGNVKDGVRPPPEGTYFANEVVLLRNVTREKYLTISSTCATIITTYGKTKIPANVIRNQNRNLRSQQAEP